MTARVLNLCFHGVGTPERALEPGEHRYWVGVDQFHRLLDEIATWPDARLSFDDGNASDFTHGLPALKERGMTASFFVLAGRLDQPGSLSRAAVRELDAAGMTIGSHGMGHRPWRGLDEASRRRELVEARAVISDVTNLPVTQAALPLGRYDRALLTELRNLDYQRVYSSDRAPARPTTWLQPRYSIRSEDSVESVRRDILAPPSRLRSARRTAVMLAKRLR